MVADNLIIHTLPPTDLAILIESVSLLYNEHGHSDMRPIGALLKTLIAHQKNGENLSFTCKKICANCVLDGEEGHTSGSTDGNCHYFILRRVEE